MPVNFGLQKRPDTVVKLVFFTTYVTCLYHWSSGHGFMIVLYNREFRHQHNTFGKRNETFFFESVVSSVSHTTARARRAHSGHHARPRIVYDGKARLNMRAGS